jgi:hypothetical protein
MLDLLLEQAFIAEELEDLVEGKNVTFVRFV